MVPNEPQVGSYSPQLRLAPTALAAPGCHLCALLAQAMYRASNGEELSRAAETLLTKLSETVRGLEARAAQSEARCAELMGSLARAQEESETARAAASLASEHAHHLVERTLAAERARHERQIEDATRQACETAEAAQAEAAALRDQLAQTADAAVAATARATAQYEAALDERSQQYAKDMRTLTASYREAREELASLGEELREARKLRSDAERALHGGLTTAQKRVDAAEARVREQSFVAAQLAGHASSALQQELLAIFASRDLIGESVTRARTAAAASSAASSSVAPSEQQRARSVHAEAALHLASAEQQRETSDAHAASFRTPGGSGCTGGISSLAFSLDTDGEGSLARHAVGIASAASGGTRRRAPRTGGESALLSAADAAVASPS